MSESGLGMSVGKNWIMYDDTKCFALVGISEYDFMARLIRLESCGKSWMTTLDNKMVRITRIFLFRNEMAWQI